MASLSFASYVSQGYGEGILTRLHTGGRGKVYPSPSQSYLTTDGQLASLPWYQATIWEQWSIFCHFHGKYFQTFADLFLWGALSEERTGL
jgi:hypothetical protein